MQEIDALASTVLIDQQGVLSESRLRLPGFYEKLDSPNKILVSLTNGIGQTLPGQLTVKVRKCVVDMTLKVSSIILYQQSTVILYQQSKRL
jgi:hypothetical protein